MLITKDTYHTITSLKELLDETIMFLAMVDAELPEPMLVKLEKKVKSMRRRLQIERRVLVREKRRQRQRNNNLAVRK